MTVEEMKRQKRMLGYTYDKIAELSGVPLGTVQKIFSGVTESPRYDTLQALEKAAGELYHRGLLRITGGQKGGTD